MVKTSINYEKYMKMIFTATISTIFILGLIGIIELRIMAGLIFMINVFIELKTVIIDYKNENRINMKHLMLMLLYLIISVIAFLNVGWSL